MKRTNYTDRADNALAPLAAFAPAEMLQSISATLRHIVSQSYLSGYDNGKAEGQEMGYANGHREGYTKGNSEGFRVGANRPKPITYKEPVDAEDFTQLTP